ncbi:MAG: VOC family protein [Treponema sp.]|nr:VOC family protein [Treponema sp.]
MNWNPLVPELTVSNFVESKRFYIDLIGFEIKYQRNDPKFAYLEYESSQIMIEEVHNDDWKTGELEYPYGRGINFQIECSNVQKIQNTLLENEYSLFREIKDTWYNTGKNFVGCRELLVQDPDGYLLRFSEDLGTKQGQPMRL